MEVGPNLSGTHHLGCIQQSIIPSPASISCFSWLGSPWTWFITSHAQNTGWTMSLASSSTDMLRSCEPTPPHEGRANAWGPCSPSEPWDNRCTRSPWGPWALALPQLTFCSAADSSGSLLSWEQDEWENFQWQPQTAIVPLRAVSLVWCWAGSKATRHHPVSP